MKRPALLFFKKIIPASFCFFITLFSFQIISGQAESAEKGGETQEGTTAFTPGEGLKPDAASFERLLRDHPDDRRIYDAYAQTLVGNKKFDEAIDVYRRALPLEDKLQNNQGTSLSEALEEVSAMKSFFEAMKKEPSWAQARIIPFAGGEVKTNIPEAYSGALIRDLTVLIREERAALEEILGPPRRGTPLLKIIVTGRPEEHKALWKEKKFSSGQLSSGAYSLGKNEIVVFFTGADIRGTLAHELTHCFLRELYIKQPSLLLDEGLSNYLSFKFAKAGSKSMVEEALERFKDLREEKPMEKALDIFSSWKRYEQSPVVEEKMEFYFRAWSLTAFFLDGGDPFFSKFFRDYLQYELQMGPLSRQDVENYFRANLPEERSYDLDREWGFFIEKMNYDNI